MKKLIVIVIVVIFIPYLIVSLFYDVSNEHLFFVKNQNGQPQMSNILAAVKALEESEDEFVIIADASLRHDIDDKQSFLKLLESENVEEVPAGNDAVRG